MALWSDWCGEDTVNHSTPGVCTAPMLGAEEA